MEADISAPFDRGVELAVIENDEPHVLAFPCGTVHGAWVDAKTKKLIAVFPTIGGNGRKAGALCIYRIPFWGSRN